LEELPFLLFLLCAQNIKSHTDCKRVRDDTSCSACTGSTLGKIYAVYHTSFILRHTKNGRIIPLQRSMVGPTTARLLLQLPSSLSHNQHAHAFFCIGFSHPYSIGSPVNGLSVSLPYTAFTTALKTILTPLPVFALIPAFPPSRISHTS
jgi:hypothetical protein